MLNQGPLNSWPLGSGGGQGGLLVTESDVIVPPGPRRTWPFNPAWPPSGGTYEISYSFRTEVHTWRAGKETRIAHRTTPRKEIAQRVLLFGDRLREYKDFMWDGQHRNVVMPEVTRASRLHEDLPAEQQSFRLEELPYWVWPGGFVVFGDGPHREAILVSAVKGRTTAYLAAPTQRQWPAGTPIYPGRIGMLSSQVTAGRRTTEAASAEVSLKVFPLSEVPRQPDPPQALFDNRELFLRKPNWAEAVDSSLGHDVDVLDYNSGPVYRFVAVQFGYELTSATYLNRSRSEADDLLDLFLRMRGQQGEFYMPTWENDFRVVVGAGGTSTLRVAGPRLYERYASSTTHKALFIQLKDGTVLPRRVLGIGPGPDDDSLITVGAPWHTTLSPDNVMISGWLLLRRFATDNLTIEWLTDQVANAQINLMTLEDLPPE